MKKSTLVLVRHGQSEWNKKNLFTGWKDPNLTKQGINEASEAPPDLTFLFVLSLFSEGAVSPKPPNMTLINDLFIALHII